MLLLWLVSQFDIDVAVVTNLNIIFFIALYDVASNNLPEQTNYQEEYDMRITSNCTYGAPLCQWTITVCIAQFHLYFFSLDTNTENSVVGYLVTICNVVMISCL